MKTGDRFWQLIGLVFFILGAYGLVDLYDQIKEKNNQLDRQYQILVKHQMLMQNDFWAKNLKAVNLVQKAWLSTLPLEDSVAVAKAHLLNDMRVLAKNTGAINLSITASEIEEDDNATSVDNNTVSSQNKTSNNYKKNEPESLPVNVHLIKVKLTGRFDPTVFTKLIHNLEESGKIITIERVSVRGPQMELNLRYYWRNNPVKATTMAKITDTPTILQAR